MRGVGRCFSGIFRFFPIALLSAMLVYAPALRADVLLNSDNLVAQVNVTGGFDGLIDPAAAKGDAVLQKQLGVSTADTQERRTSLIRLNIPTAYDDSSKSLTLLQALVDHLPPRKVTYFPPITKFIFQEYNVSVVTRTALTFLPKTYTLLERAILRMNKVAKPEDLPSGGEIEIPYIPKKALVDFNTLKTMNRVPSIAEFSAEILKPTVSQPLSTAEVNIAEPPKVLAEGRPATQSQSVELEIPQELVPQIMQDSAFTTLADADVFNFMLPVQLAGSGASSPDHSQDHAVLSDDQHKLISGLLASKAQRDAILFVLDTGWPDPDTYRQSQSDLSTIIAKVWMDYFHQPPPTRTIGAFPGNPTNPHCGNIQRALGELTALDSNKRIKIIYIPLTKEQNASATLADLLQTKYLYWLMKPSKFAAAPRKSDVQEARKWAEQTVDKFFPEKWVGDDVHTDKSVLDSILVLGQAYTEKLNTVFFVNESWTVPHDEYFIAFESPQRGAILAAAGNSGTNINTGFVDFAERCLLNKDTIAVVNARADQPDDGLLCCSSKVDPRNLDVAFAVAFDGEISGQTCSSLCGTSFSAPRVAWLLAADEVLRSSNLDITQWALSLQQRLTALRDQQATGYKKMILDVTGFFGQHK
jgi:hypothetical protein